ncbi:4-phosphopantetheinyl transferase family protein [Flavobacterium sp. CYK-4]|uniref:4'-phosphopantetheinyl transferase family protein n=1 Tax=Flavobacterium lotistagni TaxID=2709660 RepID=UPI0014074772|nr:4'-phosphopantetheinyl transferase superfamily protein [Flavobacterium lotistagni]NHM06868.1 4-phosphopantetheinyl transferase family protein [Flavobacterium lotistagni]
MIGNDIIDLELASKQSNYQRKGLIEKLFNLPEQQLILGADQPEIFFWNLWSRKEAAYKIYHRATKIRAFNPKQFSCELPFYINGILLGKVVTNHDFYWVRTTINSSYIYSEAVLNSEDFHNISEVDLVNIEKDLNGIPYHKISNNPISVTHHGNFERRIQLNRQIEPRL